MSATAETQVIGKKPATPRAVFILRFTSTIILWTVALLIAFSGFELAFWGLISAFGLISLWEFYARATEFQAYSDDLRRSHALRELLLLFPFWTGEFLRV